MEGICHLNSVWAAGEGSVQGIQRLQSGWLGGLDSRIQNTEDRKSASVEGRSVDLIWGIFSLRYWSDFSVKQTTGKESHREKAWCIPVKVSCRIPEMGWGAQRRVGRKRQQAQPQSEVAIAAKRDSGPPNLEVKELGPSPSFLTQSSAVLHWWCPVSHISLPLEHGLGLWLALTKRLWQRGYYDNSGLKPKKAGEFWVTL